MLWACVLCMHGRPGFFVMNNAEARLALLFADDADLLALSSVILGEGANHDEDHMYHIRRPYQAPYHYIDSHRRAPG
jgi:hypothetical protein